MVMSQLALSVNRWFCAAALAILIIGAAPALALSPIDAPSGTHIYQVMRDGQAIGQLRQDFDRKDGRLTVVTVADVSVSFLGLNIYEADQRVEETWVDGKLMSVVSKADVDGDGREVTLRRQGDRMVGIYNGKERNLPASLVPTTLWNSAITQAKAVLDTSKGKARKIQVADLGEEQIVVTGQQVSARHFSVTGEFNRELWYGQDGMLLAVEMQGKDGSTIRQELLQSR